jgi:acylphosphatase
MPSQYDIKISGRVQGVGFRAAASREARYLHLSGWVENLDNGSVRAVICGDQENCSKFISWCRAGSAYSWVERVDIREMEPEKLDPFRIIY